MLSSNAIGQGLSASRETVLLVCGGSDGYLKLHVDKQLQWHARTKSALCHNCPGKYRTCNLHEPIVLLGASPAISCMNKVS